MKYDFVNMPDRRGNDALAVDAPGEPNGFVPGRPKDGFSLIPMWVADMSFIAAPSITDAIVRRASHPSFGYFQTSRSYYDAIISWQKRRNGADVGADDIGYENGVLGALCSALRAFTSQGSSVIVHSPTYIGFTNTLNNYGRHIVSSPLFRDGDGIWRMDYDDMDKKICDNNIHFAIFCSPHNPTGRVWEKDEIEQAMDVYRKNNVIVFSDEIWSDIILSGNKFIPTQSVSEDAKQRTIAAYAPSKTFNLAGLIGSYHIIYNKYLRDRMKKESDLTGYNNINVLSQHALIGAYCTEGSEWTDELCSVLTENVGFAYDFIISRFHGISLAKPQGTYLLYLDMSEYLKSSGRTLDEVLKAGWDVGVAWQDGRGFGSPDSVRMNLALPTALVAEAFERLERYVFN